MCLFPGGLKHFLSVLIIAKEQTATFPPAGRTVRGQNKAHSDKHGCSEWLTAIPLISFSLAQSWSSFILLLVHEKTSSQMFTTGIPSFSEIPVHRLIYPLE